jgi:hypothetical protein
MIRPSRRSLAPAPGPKLSNVAVARVTETVSAFEEAEWRRISLGRLTQVPIRHDRTRYARMAGIGQESAPAAGSGVAGLAR